MNGFLPQVLIVLWLNFILDTVPVRVVATFAELLIGAMISGSGHITDALLAVGHQKHFSTYYRFITKAKWSWFSVVKQFIKLLTTFFPRREWNFIIDDFICPRVSKKAPNAAYHYDHSRKPNRSQYIWGQQWIALGLSFTWGRIWSALPILFRLHKKVGNRSKIKTASLLLKTVAPFFLETGEDIILRCLVDCWYMKSTFILPLFKLGIQVIGQVRKDTALFSKPVLIPGVKKKRGRPRKYGEKWTAERVKEQLPLHQAMLNIYGSCKLVKYRSTQCLARFLLGQSVMAVWCQLPGQKGWTLILSTDLTLTPQQIIKLYARRWKTEPMFNEIKHAYGVANVWEQTSRSAHRWVSMICLSYSLTRLLSLVAVSKNNNVFVPIIQWRIKSVVTAGLVRKGLELFFRQFTFTPKADAVSRLWNPKSKKLILKMEPMMSQKIKDVGSL